MWQEIHFLDSVNLHLLYDYSVVHGWPGLREQGPEADKTAFLIVLHGDKFPEIQLHFQKLLQDELEKNNTSATNYAYLVDRILVYHNKKPQLYGTQLRYNPNTGKQELYPLQDSSRVHFLRDSIGLVPLKDYLELYERH